MRRAIVLGLGASGEAAAELLRREGHAVTIVDRSPAAAGAALDRATALAARGVEVQAGIVDLPAGRFDLCVVSPGIPTDHPWVSDLEARGAEVVSELELGWRHTRAPILAVTGSNGKSTTVKLCGEALEAAGFRASLGGNYGDPLCRLVLAGAPCDWIVVEVSSFQMERTSTFRPRVGVLLNVFPNHLDRHGEMATYVAMKHRLFDCMTAGDTGLVLDDLAGAAARGTRGHPSWVTFGTTAGAALRFSGGLVVDRSGGVAADLRGTIFDNPVWGVNAAAAAGAVFAAGGDGRALERAARAFRPLQHRMTEVASVRGVTFINDSKATTLAALSAALTMCKGRVRLICGGLLKEKTLETVRAALAARVARAYLIGKAADAMSSAWSGAVDCLRCGDLASAVSAAWRDSAEGDVVLLSPGCASFDQFRSFEDRGRQFEVLVRRIEEGEVR